MSAVEVTISGVLYDKVNRTMQNVVLIGEASLTGLGVGGGPMPPGSGGPVPPLGIWGPTDPRPTPPIALPPGYGRPPLGTWGGAGEPFPTPPIVIPAPPDKPPEPPTDIKPPPPDGGWGWHPEYGWGYFPGGGGKPQPPGK